jgi:azurin
MSDSVLNDRLDCSGGPGLRSRRQFLWETAGVLLLAGCGQSSGPSRQHVDLYIQSDGDFLAYKPDMLSCPTGADVRLTFHHAGAILSQKHDWVLVKPGTVQAVLSAGKDESEEHAYLRPRDPRVIAATALCGKGETVTVDFIAPAPGDYPFFCSTPGHAEDMHGILHVTPA